MNQLEYEQAISEMVIPASKIIFWIETIEQKQYNQCNSVNRDLFGRVKIAAQNLVDLISEPQLDEQTEGSEIFTHILGGPIITIRDSTKLMLVDYRESEGVYSKTEEEYIRYLKKINSAAEYLSSLNRDAVLNIMLAELNNKGEK